MVKLEVEPNRLTQFLQQSLAYSKTPMSDSSLIVFTPKKALINCNIASDLIVFAEYHKNYFISLEVDKEELFMSTVTQIKDRLGHGFKGEKITMLTDDENVIFQGTSTDDKVTEKLEVVNRDKISPYKYKPSEIGLLPQKFKEKGNPEGGTIPMPFDLQAQIPTSAFSDLPTYEEITIKFDGKELKFLFNDTLGSRKRPVPIKKFFGDNQKKCEVKFNMKVLQSLIDHFSDEVWMSLNAGMAALSTTNKDYSLTYIFAAKQ